MTVMRPSESRNGSGSIAEGYDMKIKTVMKNMVKGYIYDHMLPRCYAKGARRKINSRKVLFVDDQYDQMTDSFQVLYDTLVKDYDVEVHTHFLGKSYVSNGEYMKRARAMLADMSDAGFVFMNVGSEAVSCVKKRPETVITQLWHACGAFKKFGMSAARLPGGAGEEAMRRHPFYANLNLVTVSGEAVIPAYEDAMDLNPADGIVQALGVSRTDIFYDPERQKQARKNILERFPAAADKKIILYAPTFRGNAGKAQGGAKLNIAEMHRQLGDDYLLLIREHPMVKEKTELPEKLKGSWVCDASGDVRIEDLLMTADVCITDYSSLIFEYALMDKPMIFYAPDLDEYFDQRGFYVDYESWVPGPVCRDQSRLTEELLRLKLSSSDREAADPFAGKRHAFREENMSACDGHATERILKAAFGQAEEQLRRKEGGRS